MTFYEECSAAIDEDIDALCLRLKGLYEEGADERVHAAA